MFSQQSWTSGHQARGRKQSADSEEKFNDHDQEKEIGNPEDKEELTPQEVEAINEDVVRDSYQPESQEKNEPVKPSKKKRRKSSVIAFGFTTKNKKNDSANKIEKPITDPPRTYPASSLQTDTIPEMEVVDEKDETSSEKSEPVSHKSEPKSQRNPDGKSVKSVESAASNSTHIIESFLVTTKEAFGTTKAGAERVIDKSVEVKNSLFENKEQDKAPEPVQEEETPPDLPARDEPDDIYQNVPNGDAHLQRLWRSITGDNRFEHKSDSESEWTVLDDYENLPQSNQQYDQDDEGAQLYTVPESVSIIALPLFSAFQSYKVMKHFSTAVLWTEICNEIMKISKRDNVKMLNCVNAKIL